MLLCAAPNSPLKTVGYGTFLWETGGMNLFPCSLHSGSFTAHPAGWQHLVLPPLGGSLRVQPLFISLTAPCANTAVMSWGERRLITDCSVSLPVPLGELYTVNWTTTPRERPLRHENSIIYQKTVSHCAPSFNIFVYSILFNLAI